MLFGLGDEADEIVTGAYALLADRLEWSETEHGPNQWSVTVTVVGADVFGHDGHLLGPREACRRQAFLSLLGCAGDPETSARVTTLTQG